MNTTNLLKRFIIYLIIFPIFFSSCTKIEKTWDKSYGGNNDDELRVVISTDDGFLLCGYSNSPAIQSASDGKKTAPLRGGYDYWIVKTDKQGNFQWDKSFGGSGDDYLTCAIQVNDGFVLGGYSNSPSGSEEGSKTINGRGGNDYWVVKIDYNGRMMFDKTYGGSGDDKMSCLIAVDNYLIFGGSSNSQIEGEKTAKNLGENDYWIIKTDMTGNSHWDRTFGGTGEDIMTAIDGEREYVECLGYSNSMQNLEGLKTANTNGGNDYWGVAISLVNNFPDQNHNDFSYGGNQDDILTSVLKIRLPNLVGLFYYAGYSNSGVTGNKRKNTFGDYDYWVTTNNGDINSDAFDKCFGGNGRDVLRCIQKQRGAGFLLGGESFSNKSGNKSGDGFGGSDFWLVSTDETMNVFSDKTFGGTADDAMYSIQEKYNSPSNIEYILAGTSKSSISGNKAAPLIGGRDFWLVNVSIKK